MYNIPFLNSELFAWVILPILILNKLEEKTSFVEHLKKGARFITGRNVLIEYLDGVTKWISKEKARGGLGKIDRIFHEI